MADRDGDRPKKSWREVDARRDRSSSGSSSSSGARREEGGHSRSAADRASRQYRAALEALFDKGGVGKVAEKLGASSLAPTSNQAQATPTPAAGTPVAPRSTAPIPAADAAKQALRKKVLEAIGRDAITRAADKYLKEHPLPEDWELLEQIVEHRDDDRVREVLATLGTMLDRERPKRSRVLGAKLRFIEETSDDRELRALAAAVRARLG
jgi:hypothetical protein